ncbi:MAG: hypothetical protein OSB62_08095, partial [Alphaproteobacteria bacterium]|nr:hypothetical protein [Alphaproteobacteria bacterium]
MSKTTLIQKQSVWLGGRAFSPYISSLALNAEVEAVGAKTLGDNTVSYVPGLKMANAQFEGLYEKGSIDEALFNGFDSTDDILTMPLLSEEEGNPVYFFRPLKGGLTYNGERGQMFNVSIAGKVTSGDLCRGKIIRNGSAVSADETSTALNLGTVPAGKKLVAALHVFAVDDNADSLDV